VCMLFLHVQPVVHAGGSSGKNVRMAGQPLGRLRLRRRANMWRLTLLAWCFKRTSERSDSADIVSSTERWWKREPAWKSKVGSKCRPTLTAISDHSQGVQGSPV
jgi:hypothetical protein